MPNRFIAVSFGLLIAIATMPAQEAGKPDATGNVPPVTGKQLYASYCALCHGIDGKGSGSFAPQLKTSPPDLTQLTKKNHQTFPSMRVQEAIDGEYGKKAHGTVEMPIWGPVFRSMAHGKKDSAQVRINNLVKYIESLQER